MPIEAVIFDADGVLIYPWRFARYLEEKHGIVPERTLPFFKGSFHQCLLGELDLKEALIPILPNWGWQQSVDKFVSIWLEIEDALDLKIVNVIRGLRNAGIICCVATNQEKYRTEYMMREMGFNELFDHSFFSCKLGVCKPDHIYYKMVTKSLCIEEQNILFWDDSQSHVKSARECGWKAEVYDDFSTFKEKLDSYLISGVSVNQLLQGTP